MDISHSNYFVFQRSTLKLLSTIKARQRRSTLTVREERRQMSPLIKNRTCYQQDLEAAATVWTLVSHPPDPHTKPNLPLNPLVLQFTCWPGERPTSASKLPLVLAASLGPRGDSSACSDAASPGNSGGAFIIPAFSPVTSPPAVDTPDRRSPHRGRLSTRRPCFTRRLTSRPVCSRRGETATRWQM